MHLPDFTFLRLHGRYKCKCLALSILMGGGISIAQNQPEPPCDCHLEAVTVKTNAIGWGMLIPNATVEFEWGDWSAQLPVYYSDLDYFSHRVKFHVFALQPGLRYWFNSHGDGPGHTGFFAGGHLGIVWYNMALGGTDRIQDHNGRTPSLGGGLEGGWRTNLDADGRWKLELSLGLGVYSMKYDRIDNPRHRPAYLQYTRSKTFLGLDHVGVSIGYTFDTRKKGGEQ